MHDDGRFLGAHEPSLTVVCCQLLDPKWKLEIEAMAARERETELSPPGQEVHPVLITVALEDDARAGMNREVPMAYDEGLAERLRGVLRSEPDITERKMFGGLAFLSRGYMFIGISGNALMARVGPEYYEAALALPHVRVMDFTGKPMKGYVFVDPAGHHSDHDLSAWAERCHGFVRSLPPKKSK